MSTTTLQPGCIASDGTALYAHATVYQGSQQTIVLAKSSPSPASPLDVTWTLVSAVSQTKLYHLQGLASIKSFACTVSSQGVFTILAMNSRSFDGDQAPSRARGYQYDPADGGKWTNIDVTDKYKWSILTSSTMFYATVNGGDPVLMHVYGTSHIVDTITVSIFNKATNTFMEQNATWALPLSSGSPESLAYNGGSLYVVSNVFAKDSFLNIMPVDVTGAPPALTSIKTMLVNTTCPLYTGTKSSYVAGSSYYLFCSDSGQEQNFLVTSDGNSVGPSILTNSSIRSPESFLPLGPPGGPATWAFMTNSTAMFGLTLTGTKAGAWQEVPYQMNVTGLPGSGSGSGWGLGSGSGSGIGGGSPLGAGLSAGALIGIIGSSVIFLVLGVLLWKRKRVRRATEVVDAPYTLQPATEHPYGSSEHEMGSFLQTPPQAHSQTHLQPQAPPYPLPPSKDQSYSPHQLPPYPTTQHPQHYPAVSTVGHPQSATDSHEVWSPMPSDTTTLISNSPQYSNAYSQDPQGYMSPASLGSTTSLVPGNPQVYAAAVPGAPQSWGEQPAVSGVVVPAGYRRAPQDRQQDLGSQQYHN